jgi:ubiquinone/menaquinone biosynthesis C-methylase UbiE
MPLVDFTTELHVRTERDYLLRVNEADKAECAEKAIQWGYDYWDGDRATGYGGYHYDGRWKSVAKRMIDHYQLPEDARILDVGCGKGFLLYEFSQLLPNAELVGIDVSEYAIEHSKPEIKDQLQIGDARELPFGDDSFDLVFSITTLHNLYLDGLFQALQEVERVGKNAKYITMDAYRTEQEKANLMYWQLTLRAFHTPEEWEWLFQQAGYSGDYSFIYFE